MRYKDIEEAWAKRTAKEDIKGIGKRGRKRKSTALKADEPELEDRSASLVISREAYAGTPASYPNPK